MDDVTHAHIVQRDFDLLALALDAGSRGSQAHQFLDRFGGAPLGTRLEVLTQPDEGDDDRCRLEVDMPADNSPA